MPARATNYINMKILFYHKFLYHYYYITSQTIKQDEFDKNKKLRFNMQSVIFQHHDTRKAIIRLQSRC